MDILKLFDKLNQLGEQEQIEAKTASAVGRSILETVCAFANEPNLGGGYLLLGINNVNDSTDNGYRVEGIKNPEKLLEDLVSQCRTVFNKPIPIETYQECIDDKVVVAVFVPEVNHNSKPIYFKKQGLPQGAYRRMGTSDVRCTDDDLLVLYQNRDMESYDFSRVLDTTWEDINLDAIEDYRKVRAALYPSAPELHWTDKELLQSLGGLRREEGHRYWLNAQADAGLSLPLFESERSRDLFVATFLFHHFLSDEDIRWLAHFKDYQLSDEQAKALIFVREVGAINNAAYRNLNQVDTLNASQSLRQLRDLDLLIQKNKASAAYYVLNEKQLKSMNCLAQEPKEQVLSAKEQVFVAKEQVLEPKEQVPELNDLPDNLQLAVKKIGKKAPKTAMEQIILALCHWKEMTSEELSSILQRDKARLIRIYLTPMVEAGLLAYKFPRMSKHPRQAYRIAENSKEKIPQCR